MYYKYFFHINDKALNEEYDFEGYFEDHFEADRFITENENDGNIVTMKYPFWVMVNERPEW